MIRFGCPKCKLVLQVPPQQVGATVICSKCRTPITVPGSVSPVPAPAASPPPSVKGPHWWAWLGQELRAIPVATWTETVLLCQFLSAWVRKKFSKHNPAPTPPAPLWPSDRISQRRILIGYAMTFVIFVAALSVLQGGKEKPAEKAGTGGLAQEKATVGDEQPRQAKAQGQAKARTKAQANHPSNLPPPNKAILTSFTNEHFKTGYQNAVTFISEVSKTFHQTRGSGITPAEIEEHAEEFDPEKLKETTGVDDIPYRRASERAEYMRGWKQGMADVLESTKNKAK